MVKAVDVLQDAYERLIIWEEVDVVHHRAAAIMAAAQVEDELTRALSRFFIDFPKRQHDKLFKSSGPLSTFAAKIQISFALGFFMEIVRKDLDLIRQIRNEFAHSLSPINFDSLQIMKKIDGLGYVDLLAKEARFDPTAIDVKQEANDSPNRYKYVHTCRILTHHFWWSALQKESLPAPSEPIPNSEEPDLGPPIISS